MFRAPLFEEKKERSYVVGLVASPFSPKQTEIELCSRQI